MLRHLINIHLEMKASYKVWWMAGLLCILLSALFFLASLVDQRTVNSINTWYKPMKFCLSVGIYLLTIIWIIDFLNIAKKRKNRLVRYVSVIILLELFLIVMQGARGIPSHYNITSTPNKIIFQLMGVLIVLNTILLIRITILYLKNKTKPNHISQHLVNFIIVGLLLLLFSSIIGGFMIGFNRHLTSPEITSNLYIPILDWKLGSGDLRISHFLGIHGLQIFALAGIYINSSPDLKKLKLFGFYTFVGAYYLIVFSVFIFTLY